MSIVEDLILLSIFFVVVLKYIQINIECIKQREYFIKVLNHDLRVASIAQIRGLELLEKSPSPSENKELVTSIKESSIYTLEMLTMLINTFKYNNGENVLNLEVFNIATLINKLNEELKELLGKKNLSLKILMQEDIMFYGDVVELAKVLKILLLMAINYSDKNRKIFLKFKNLKNENIILINYKGQKISEEEYNRMFNNNSRFSIVGQGIKLHYCKKIVDFHKGKIEVTNGVDKNTFFTISIPHNSNMNCKKTSFISRFQLRKISLCE